MLEQKLRNRQPTALQGLGLIPFHSFDGLPPAAQYALGLSFHTNSNVAFPLTLWYVYPASLRAAAIVEPESEPAPRI